MIAQASTRAELRIRWDERDRRYGIRPPGLDDGGIAAVRSWRLCEAQELGDAALALEARTWRPPVELRGALGRRR